MFKNIYTVFYKLNGKSDRELVQADDILSAVTLYQKVYPERLILSIVYLSQILV